MAQKTNFLEGKLLEHVLRNIAYTGPATVYVALFSTAPTDAGAGAGELSGNAYARQAVTFGAAAGTPRQCANTAACTFGPATPGAWSTATHFGIFDALTVGNLLYWGALPVSKTAAAGDSIQFAIGQLTISED